MLVKIEGGIQVLFKKILLLVALCAVVPSHAGVLNDLEESATKPKSKSDSGSSGKTNNSGRESSSSNGDSIGGDLAAGFFTWVVKTTLNAIGSVIAYGGESSWQRYAAKEPEDKDSLFRVPGDGLLPTAKIDTHFLLASDDITGHQTRVEAGYGLLGVSHTKNRLFERSDSLTMDYTLFHYRMSFGNRFSWDFAAGSGRLHGEDRYDGTVSAMPMRYRFSDKWYGEYFPVWSSYNGGAMAEHQFGLNWQQKYFGVSMGYKEWLTDNTNVEGFFVGMNIVY